MPLLDKQIISNYLRSDCQRRLRQDLSPDTRAYQAEREREGMPPRIVRPGLAALAAAGEEWQNAKVNDLVQTLGIESLIGQKERLPSGKYQFSRAPLSNLISQAEPDVFLVEVEFEVGPSFFDALDIGHLQANYELRYRDLRPDLIQIITVDDDTQYQEVMPDGSTLDIHEGDQRLALRVLDIKLTAEPSVPYFIEVTYYAMALAGWLRDNNFADRFFVLPQPTVWPGSHDASAIVRLHNEKHDQGTVPTKTETLVALEEDLEIGEFGVFCPRLRRFFQEELETILGTDWRQLPWHVDNRCIGCEYLGYPWPGSEPDPEHCWSLAGSLDHLSRVAFVSRGARMALEDRNINSVSTLAATQPTDPAYDDHHVLRGTRTIVAGRAEALHSGQSEVPPQVGTSAILPKWADLRIYLTADFDIGSGITIAFGFQAVWAVSPERVPEGEHYRRIPRRVFPVDQRSPETEQRELSNLLEEMDRTLRRAQDIDEKATMQVYIWDRVTYDHLVRVIGRHLTSFIDNRALRRLAWLFPPDSVVANPDLSDRKSPVSIVRDAIRAIVATPVPHYYSLLNVAREYHSIQTQPPYNQFIVPDLFEDPLSDHIPSERAHEIWSRAGGSRPWNQQLRDLERTVNVRLSGLESVTQRLTADLDESLNQTSPRIKGLRPPTLARDMADDSRLWFVFSRLNVALSKLEIQQIHAMPPHEREARFKSAHLTRRLSPDESQLVLERFELHPAPNRWVYEIGSHSAEVRAREGDFTFALAPRSRPGFLSDRLSDIAGQMRLPPLASYQSEYAPMEYFTAVNIAGIDRDQHYIVLDLPSLHIVRALENGDRIDLSEDVMLDPIHRDFLIQRLEATLNAIGNPPQAVEAALPEVLRATGRTRRPTRGHPRPVSELYWGANDLYQAEVPRDLTVARTLLEHNNEYQLNQSQWLAWEEALTHRLRLIWGPPGTGKSRTLRTIVMGALLEANRQRTPLRVLVTGPTYESIDNVLLKVYETLNGTSPLALPSVVTARLRSTTRPVNHRVPEDIDIPVVSGDHVYQQILNHLHRRDALTLIGATAHQAHKLLIDAGGAAAELFDLIVIDEASQLDVATSTLPLAGLAAAGSVVIAGDPKQLPPIHQAEAPLELDYFVGPVFTYLTGRFQLEPSVLETNYRSCRELVEFAYLAGYPRSLHAHSPDLRLNLVTPLPTGEEEPADWPSNLYWTSEWATLLDPDARIVCFVYPEGRSSQWNQFEADAIAAVTWLLASRVADHPQAERDVSGVVVPTSGVSYSVEDFWSKGVGIVTPHRAQQALVLSRLHSVFPGVQAQDIRGAVDTVERYQGQQRDVIIASFALGDPDAIRDEDEFLLGLNRFNVMASRARTKLLVFVSREVVNHLSSDMQVLSDSALIKSFVESFCDQGRPMQLGSIREETLRTVAGLYRWHTR